MPYLIRQPLGRCLVSLGPAFGLHTLFDGCWAIDSFDYIPVTQYVPVHKLDRSTEAVIGSSPRVLRENYQLFRRPV